MVRAGMVSGRHALSQHSSHPTRQPLRGVAASLCALPRVVWLLCVTLIVTCVMSVPRSLHAQRATGRLEGTVTDAQTAAPLPYAVVSIPTLSVERFTDASGRFVLGAVPAGRHDVVIRRIGFTPWRGTVQVTADSTTTLAAQLDQLPHRLTAVAVRDMARCRNPGAPDPVLQSEVFSLVSQLRENAARYRLLAEQYPFAYMQTRGLGELRDSTFTLSKVDTSLVQSITRVQYRPGNIVTRTYTKERGDEFTMAIPTLIELTDDAFVRNHCFGFGGTVKAGNETWVRVNMRAADKLRSPDVHGAFFLDSATSQLRRMDLDMSRPDLLPYQLQRVEAVHVVTTFRDIASGLSVIESVCAVHSLRTPPGADPLPSPAELQLLLGYRFESPPPDVPKFGAARPPTWITGTKLPRNTVWCEPQ